MRARESRPRQRHLDWIGRAWTAALLSGLLALGVRLVHLDAPAYFDELYHLLAAQGWLEHGELRIAEGTYERTPLFTIVIAAWMGLFGNDLAVARLPSVFAGTALVVAVHLWVRQEAGKAAGWMAALLLVFWPDGIDISQFLRFYALQGLLFWLGAIAVYRLVARGFDPWAAAAAPFALAAALYLQMVSLIGMLGLALWVGLALTLDRVERPRRQHLLVATLALAGVALVAAVFLRSESGAELLAEYRRVPLWNRQWQDAFWYYHLQLMLDYAVLWPLSAFAVLIGLATRPRPTGFCTCVFATAFLLHSFAGAKDMRYVYYAVPFLFVLWAIALAEIGPPLWRFFEAHMTRVLGAVALGTGRTVFAGVLLLVVLTVMAMNGAVVKVAAHFAGVDLPPNPVRPDWAAARETLEPWLRDADVVLTTSELEALHYLGHYDILISKSRLTELDPTNRDFARDPRTGRPMIGSAAAVALVIDCHPKGLIVSTDYRWRNPAQLDHEVANLIVEQTRKIDLDARGLHAYGWDHGGRPPRPPAACAQLPDIRARS